MKKVWTCVFASIAIAATVAAVKQGDMLICGGIASIMGAVSWTLWDSGSEKEDK
ncbi:MAG: hypothetical protein IAB99_05430 [Bacteroidetes bacterium]|uniref:Uncharacterized protein n=1 Tax=Candidatus Cryptobacteroides faecipullorum TaxID=2840764 RepID=A0A9D9I722_9BACT|nr:hypothetical protein [Candidatus Cryptobacteroides faecipullorum]